MFFENTRLSAFKRLIAFMALAVAGCGSDNPNQITIAGHLDTGDYKSVASDATAHVSLIQHSGRTSDRRIVAERSLNDIGSLPVKFDITIGKDLINDRGGYALEAEILGADGVVRWSTPKAVDIKPMQSPQSVSLILRSIGVVAHSVFVRYQCGDGFQFAARAKTREALLQIGNRRLTLTRSHASIGSLTSYSDEHGNQLNVGSANASLKLDGHGHENCDYVPSASGSTNE